MNERERRSGKRRKDGLVVQSPIEKFCSEKKNHVLAQHIDFCKRYRRQIGPKDHDAVITQEVLSSFETRWATSEGQLALMPGKKTLSSLNVVAETRNVRSVLLQPQLLKQRVSTRCHLKSLS